MIAAAERPLIIVGDGRAVRWTPIIALAERLGAPVATTFKAKGLISDDHPFGCGVLGRSGTPIASLVHERERPASSPSAPRSRTTPASPTTSRSSRSISTRWPSVASMPSTCRCRATSGDVHCLARRGLRRCRCVGHRTDAEVAERWAIWRAEKASRAGDDRGHGVNAAAMFAALADAVPDDAVITVDVGNNTYCFGRYFECGRTGRADVRLPRVDRLRLAGGHGRLGCGWRSPFDRLGLG